MTNSNADIAAAHEEQRRNSQNYADAVKRANAENRALDPTRHGALSSNHSKSGGSNSGSGAGVIAFIVIVILVLAAA